ncbi:MAG: hypothetical protein FWF53_07770 [Candidatus Azobacteroides sp.]|nr:hypothetical protein [Candidatus Azobacteroides sp.]
MENMEKEKKRKKKVAKSVKKEMSAKDRIKPRGLWGWMEGKIHYDENEDIFNLGL